MYLNTETKIYFSNDFLLLLSNNFKTNTGTFYFLHFPKQAGYFKKNYHYTREGGFDQPTVIGQPFLPLKKKGKKKKLSNFQYYK